MKPMKRSFISSLILTGVIAGGLTYWSSTAERRNADQIIAAVENYRETHGRLPDPRDHKVMKDLGFKLRAGWHPDYEVGENGRYRITILEGFDGPYWIYDSFSDVWHRDFPPVNTTNENIQAKQGAAPNP